MELLCVNCRDTTQPAEASQSKQIIAEKLRQEKEAWNIPEHSFSHICSRIKRNMQQAQ